MKFNKNDKVIVVNTGDVWENKKGIILGDFDKKEITEETEDFLVKIYFNDDKTVMQTFNKNNLELDANIVVESLNESKKIDKDDFIHNYVYLKDLDDNIIPSWFFVDKIAAAENIESVEVINAAIKFGYKLFQIVQNHFKRAIVAEPNCKIKTLSDECAEYILGSAVVTELKVREIK